jgi:putative hydrolase
LIGRRSSTPPWFGIETLEALEAAAGQLVRIAPRRFNPASAAWLPILHTSRGRRHYTALFSNTARPPPGPRQCTVVTAEFGSLKGRRIVGGREREHDAARVPER